MIDRIEYLMYCNTMTRYDCLLYKKCKYDGFCALCSFIDFTTMIYSEGE